MKTNKLNCEKPHDMHNIKLKCEKLRNFPLSLFHDQNDTFSYQGRTTKTVTQIFYSVFHNLCLLILSKKAVCVIKILLLINQILHYCTISRMFRPQIIHLSSARTLFVENNQRIRCLLSKKNTLPVDDRLISFRSMLEIAK